MEDAFLDELDERGRRSAETVVDLDSDMRTCPACLHQYKAGPVRCPECRLHIGA